jgi:hypothetical protein
MVIKTPSSLVQAEAFSIALSAAKWAVEPQKAGPDDRAAVDGSASALECAEMPR